MQLQQPMQSLEGLFGWPQSEWHAPSVGTGLVILPNTPETEGPLFNQDCIMPTKLSDV